MTGYNFLRICSIFLLLSGCAAMEQASPLETKEVDATLATKTNTMQLLEQLPLPEEQLVVAVYEFGDKTGQQKPGDIAQYSKAVTQDGLSIVKKALLDASGHKWFKVLERGGLDHLLQERKIIRSMREEYAGPDGRQLPSISPMLYAGLLLEGGIVSYESNVMTGGIGARYLGIGGSSKYSRDMVTIYLRLVSVSTGEVLLSVNTSKTIFSTAISGGVFKFVSYDSIMEAETGMTINEPPQLAVRQAIEMGVYAMVMEGAKNNLWRFKNPQVGQQALNKYLDKYYGKKTDPVEIIENAEAIGSADQTSKPGPMASVAGSVVAQKVVAQSSISDPFQQLLRREWSNLHQSKASESPAEQQAAAAALNHLNNQDYAQARQTLLNAMVEAHSGDRTPSARLILLMGICHDAAGSKQNAAIWYQQALKSTDPHDRELENLIQRIKRLDLNNARPVDMI